jgi:hypothetical protein
MNLGGEREDSAPTTGEIGNPNEEIVPVEANKTPQIKENRPEASGTSPESLVPQVSSIKAVSLIVTSHANSIPVQLSSHSQQGVRVQGGYWDPLVNRKKDP